MNIEKELQDAIQIEEALAEILRHISQLEGSVAKAALIRALLLVDNKTEPQIPKVWANRHVQAKYEAGKCPSCPADSEPLTNGERWCAYHKHLYGKRNAAKRKQEREDDRSNRICTRCRETPADVGRLWCETCRQKHYDGIAKRRADTYALRLDVLTKERNESLQSQTNGPIDSDSPVENTMRESLRAGAKSIAELAKAVFGHANIGAQRRVQTVLKAMFEDGIAVKRDDGLWEINKPKPESNNQSEDSGHG